MIKFDKRILEILNNKEFNNNELLDMLNAIIDEELKKENPDFDYIDECTEAMLYIQTGKRDVEVPDADEELLKTVSAHKRVQFSKRALRVILIAAILFATTVSANAAYTNSTGNSIIESIVISVAKKKPKHKKETSTKENTTATYKKSYNSYNIYNYSNETTVSEDESNYYSDYETTTETTTELTTDTVFELSSSEYDDYYNGNENYTETQPSEESSSDDSEVEEPATVDNKEEYIDSNEDSDSDEKEQAEDPEVNIPENNDEQDVNAEDTGE